MPGPFDDLEPEEPGEREGRGERGASPKAAASLSGARARRRSSGPGAAIALGRGALRRCPRCGGGRLFASWFRIRERCPRCGLRLEREEGGFLGAMALNYTATAVAFVALLAAWLLVDLPDLQVLRLTVAAVAVALLVPLLFWPFSKTIWAAVDYLVYRTDPDYASRDAADRASGNGGRP